MAQRTRVQEAIGNVAKNNPKAMTVLAELIRTEQIDGFIIIELLSHLQIKGEKIWKLYEDCANKEIETLKKTVLVLATESFSEQEIQNNLELKKAIPFIDPTINITEEVEEGFRNLDLLVINDFAKETAEIVKPKIAEQVEEFQSVLV